MQRYLAKIAYDGTAFCGWQIQPQDRTVQAVVEAALSVVAKQPIAVTAAGRTDARVHAFGQYCHFDFPINMTTNQLYKALNTKLSKEVQIISIQRVVEDFHARYDAFSRTYKYIITTKPTPFERSYKSSFPRHKLNLESMNKCIPYFIGKHDFVSFSKFNPDIKSTICEISELTVNSVGTDFVLQITADRFLHNMVRRIVGTMVNISNKNTTAPEKISEMIEAKTTANKLITTAPPQGLYLWDVGYPQNKFIKF